MTLDVGAGPYRVPYRWRPLTYEVDSVEYTHERAIATQQTGFSLVAQLNDKAPDLMRGILWFGVDDANTCVYIPVFNSTPEPPRELAHGNGDMLTLSWDAMFWANNYVANQAYNRYSQMIPDIRRVQNSLEDAMESGVKEVESKALAMNAAERRNLLSGFSDEWAERSTREFKQLGDYLFVKFLDGNIKKETAPGQFLRTPEGMCASPQFGGYSDEYFRSVAEDAGDRLKVTEPTFNK